MSVPKLSATQRMKAQAECSMLMALGTCLDSIEEGKSDLAGQSAATVVRYAFMLNPKLRACRRS